MIKVNMILIKKGEVLVKEIYVEKQIPDNLLLDHFEFSRVVFADGLPLDRVECRS